MKTYLALILSKLKTWTLTLIPRWDLTPPKLEHPNKKRVNLRQDWYSLLDHNGQQQEAKRPTGFSARLSSDAVTLVATITEVVWWAHRQPDSKLERNHPGLLSAPSHLSSVLLFASGIWGFVFSEASRSHSWRRGIVGSTVCTDWRAHDKAAALTPLPFTRSFSVTRVSTDAATPTSGAWNPSSCERVSSSLLYRSKCFISLFLKHHPLKSRLITSSSARVLLQEQSYFYPPPACCCFFLLHLSNLLHFSHFLPPNSFQLPPSTPPLRSACSPAAAPGQLQAARCWAAISDANVV